MKIFIIGNNQLEIAKETVALYDDLNICKSFMSVSMNNDMSNDYKYILDIDEIVLAFKNDALLYLHCAENEITGITLDDFYDSDIIPISMEHFNMIIDSILKDNDIVIVWVDSKIKNENYNKNLIESKYIQERAETFSLPILYFCDEDKSEISKIIIDYILADEKSRKEIVEENS